jgi:PPM family protein phosphatase
VTVLRSGSASDVGRVRTINEDFALESMTLFAVADGMGGHAGGEVAARTAIDALQHEFGRQPSADGLLGAVRLANLAVWERSQDDPDLRGMGTTLTAAALVATDQGDRLVLANVGDSRSYRLHDGSLTQLSHDHSVAEELVDRGELSEAEAAIHPHRHILTRALGVASDVDVDVWQMIPEEGDRYLLCSDGLTNEVTETRIAKLLRTTPDPQLAAEGLVRMANDNGGNDNITVVVLDVVVGEQPGSAGAGLLEVDDGLADPAARAAVTVGTAGADTAHETGAPGRSNEATATAPRRVSSGVRPTAVDPDAPSSLLGRSASETAAGMRAMSARSEEIHHRIRSRRVTIGVLAFILVLGGIVAGAVYAVHWWVDSSYFVKMRAGQVVIYRGRMGGFLGMEPRVVVRTGIQSGSVPPAYLPSVQAGVEESSLESARTYVQGLENTERADLGLPPLPGTSSTTTTTPAHRRS